MNVLSLVRGVRYRGGKGRVCRSTKGGSYFTPLETSSRTSNARTRPRSPSRIWRRRLLALQDDDTLELIQQKGFAHEAAFLVSEKHQDPGFRSPLRRHPGRRSPPRPSPRCARGTTSSSRRRSSPARSTAARTSCAASRSRRPSAPGATRPSTPSSRARRRPSFVPSSPSTPTFSPSAQGAEPRAMHLMLGDGTEKSLPRRRLLALPRRWRSASSPSPARTRTPPRPRSNDHCPFCPWRDLCDERWEADDHLNQVAGITRNADRAPAAPPASRQLNALARLGFQDRVPACAETLAKAERPGRAPARARASRRAALRASCRSTPRRVRGFHRLPAPDAGDVFFDMEGDPFEQGGLEYLFGLRYREGEACDVPAALGARPRRRARRLRGAHGLPRRAARAPSRHARLPLRALRAHGAEAPDVAARHARGAGGRAPAPRHARRPLQGGARGAAHLRGLFAQGPRGLLHAAARGRGARRRREHRPLRALARHRRRGVPGRASAATTRTTASPPTACATGCLSFRKGNATSASREPGVWFPPPPPNPPASKPSNPPSPSTAKRSSPPRPPTFRCASSSSSSS